MGVGIEADGGPTCGRRGGAAAASIQFDCRVSWVVNFGKSEYVVALFAALPIRSRDESREVVTETLERYVCLRRQVIKAFSRPKKKKFAKIYNTHQIFFIPFRRRATYS
jgi:hypothetical protein